MDQIKIENFFKENYNLDFPFYVKIDDETCAKFQRTLKSKLNLDETSDSLKIVSEINKKGITYKDKRQNEDKVDLMQVFETLGINFPKHIYVNWYRFNEIDKLKFKDIAKYFDYIWYPDVDDIDLFDESLSWILSISHYGQIKILKFD